VRVFKEARKLNRLLSGDFSAGLKASKKAIAANRAKTIYIASDADSFIIEDVSAMCRENGVEIVMAQSMQMLGNACGIKVGAAVAVLLA
jgi:large subunit ribosomal protein L7A